ncbi:hypothetical protein SAMD00019534_112140 [Acytostelium subglobosum LB1]|uniref:hypothetical protein n=1 Tax=Acytostelium subglobosum LB1 TaxID=1410327 RepID=UPI0006448E38|nr:hypothetical protein SAMD00019534_112140 [Acytostelium subglobosum LB1]GAM28038.1 hypothetical protein SAMD00019534_112140 [Acytostelium subglobosum LB1]|eukprot:XP_012748997.1 hypothetical protein SAMD00019534_112140 [Acytostelium subglobosum LB1]
MLTIRLTRYRTLVSSRNSSYVIPTLTSSSSSFSTKSSASASASASDNHVGDDDIDSEALGQGKHFNIHKPVLLKQVIDRLHLKSGACYIDATFGLGGHSTSILDTCPDCFVIGIDRDPNVFNLTKQLRQRYKDRLITVQGPFSELSTLLKENNLHTIPISGILFDFGVSSYQLDSAERGFSFRKDLDGPLDMRMDNQSSRLSAYEIVNGFNNRQLRDIMYYYGEERHTKKVAEEIIRRRSIAPIATTNQLVEIIESCIPYPAALKSISRIFRSLRMYVNDETGEVRKGLLEAEKILQPNGHLVAISFHSIEDRIVKRFLKNRKSASFDFVDGSDPVYADEQEIEWNARSKPAVLRSAMRTQKPVANSKEVDGDEDDQLVFKW